jgi:beta-xylosidase
VVNLRDVVRVVAAFGVVALGLAPASLTAQRSSQAPPAPASRQPAPTPPLVDPRSLATDLPFSMPKVALPRIPARTVRITDYGARGDGASLNTDAIAAAITACVRAGGGRVVVPRGMFLTGPIELKSRIDLHLERGALLLFSTRFEHYPLTRTSYEGGPAVKARSPIWANGAEDIAITGEGVIDGSGQAWRPVKKGKMTAAQWQALVASGGVVDAAGTTWWPSREAMNGADTVKALNSRAGEVPLTEYAAAREYLRPVMISLVECRRVLLDGPTFQNSPAWNIHPLLSEDVVIRNLTVMNPWYSQNGDGLDLDSCRRVVVHNCRFDVGDDAICIKSGKDAYGRTRGRPTEDVIITDNVVYHGHGGFTVGSEMSGGVRNILVARCTFLGTDVGLRFKTTRGRGGVVEKIWVRDVQMKDIPTDAIGFNMYYGGEAPTDAPDKPGASRPSMPVDEGTPQFRDIVLEKILCRGADRAVMIEGLPEMPIHGIVLDDVRISARRGLATVDADTITLRRLDIAAQTGPAVSVRDSKSVGIEGGAAASGTDVFLRVDGATSGGIRLADVDVSRAKTPVDLGPGVAPGAVVWQEHSPVRAGAGRPAAGVRGAPTPARPWVADQGDGTYRNPILYADYSDPDVIRVGTDFYMTASSFHCVPGLPILHSKDLVNWRLIGHALPRLTPEQVYATPQHGNGVWAPALRFHAGKFWIYYPDPDHGIFVVTAANAAGPWSAPLLVKAGKGLIDPCPLWDDDGAVYLVHAWARSRAGINNVLTLVRLSADGTRAVGDGKVIIDGNTIEGYRTLEGPKIYRSRGYYWIFAPAGGVKPGWQSVFRSRTIDGPYEGRIVLVQGSTDINGPHQGAWVDTPAGQSWFVHFQDLDAYGRVVHLQPMAWREDGWPVMGADTDGDGKGEPVRSWSKPRVGKIWPVSVPAASDEFSSPRLGVQWQWQANPRDVWMTLAARPGFLQLRAQPTPADGNLWNAPNLLLQKWPASAFVVTTAMRFSAATVGEAAGLIVFGQDYAWVGLRQTAEGMRLALHIRRDAVKGGTEQEVVSMPSPSQAIWLRVAVYPGGMCRFSASIDGRTFTALGGEAFTAKPGLWVGAKVGLFVTAPEERAAEGFADFDWVHVDPLREIGDVAAVASAGLARASAQQ